MFGTRRRGRHSGIVDKAPRLSHAKDVNNLVFPIA
jgi:hypothetical protein